MSWLSLIFSVALAQTTPQPVPPNPQVPAAPDLSSIPQQPAMRGHGTAQAATVDQQVGAAAYSAARTLEQELAKRDKELQDLKDYFDAYVGKKW